MSFAVKTEGLSKKYVIGHQRQERYETFREMLMHKVRGFGQRILHPLSPNAEEIEQEDLWALRDVNLEIQQGEKVGIIGRNGAGKTTLLKLLSRITEPSEGRFTINGRVSSLLEVGTGFHPELTGRENIFLNGAILGMSRSEIKSRFDEIVEFAEVERFLDTPVKRYSSGMYVRLAFAVAAHLEPEILIVDEVLAVGDAAFQKKCLGKMQSVGREGRTVLFVSHNLGAVSSLCDRGLLLQSGRIAADGAVEEALLQYSNGFREATGYSEVNWAGDEAPGGNEVRLRKLSFYGERSGLGRVFHPDESVTVRVEYQVYRNLEGARLVLQLLRLTGEVAFATSDQVIRGGTPQSPGVYASECVIPGKLLNTTSYQTKIWMDIFGIRYLIDPLETSAFEIVGPGNQGTWQGVENWPGCVCPSLTWTVSQIK